MIFMKYKKIFIVICFVALFLEVLFLFPKKILDSNKGESNAEFVFDENVEQDIEGVHLVVAANEKKEWELWSENAATFKDKEEWVLNKIKVYFYTDQGDYFIVTGKKGLVNEKTKNMTINGDVVIRSLNGYKLKTKTVVYSSKDRNLFSPEVVRMYGLVVDKQLDMKLTGNKMKVDLRSSDMTMYDGVHGFKKYENNKKIMIKSRASEFSSTSNKVLFEGKVVIDVNTMRITGPTASFAYSPKTNSLKELLVSGGIKVSDLDKWATSENVKAFLEDNKFIFRGSPRVVQDEDELRGDEIIFLNGGKQVRVKKGRLKVDKEKQSYE